MIDLCHDFCARSSGRFALQMTVQGDFLPGKELFTQADDAAIAAHEKRMSRLLDRSPTGCKPRGVHLQSQADPIALPHCFGAHRVLGIGISIE